MAARVPLESPEWAPNAKVAAQEDSEMWYDAGFGQRFRVPMQDTQQSLQNTQDSYWVLVKDKVAFGPVNRLDDLAFKLAQDAGLSNHQALRLRHTTMLGQIEPSVNHAFGEMKNGYPVIHATNVDRNWVYDRVMEREQNRHKERRARSDWPSDEERDEALYETYAPIIKRKIAEDKTWQEIINDIASLMIADGYEAHSEPAFARAELLVEREQLEGSSQEGWYPEWEGPSEGHSDLDPEEQRARETEISWTAPDYQGWKPRVGELVAFKENGNLGMVRAVHTDPVLGRDVADVQFGNNPNPLTFRFDQLEPYTGLWPDYPFRSPAEEDYYRNAKVSVDMLEDPVRYEFIPFTEQELGWAQKSGLFDSNAHTMNLRAKRMRIPGRVRAHELMALFNRYEGKCAYCGRPFGNTMNDQLTFDHVVPLQEGGDNVASNILPAHHRCNQALNKWQLKFNPMPVQPQALEKDLRSWHGWRSQNPEAVHASTEGVEYKLVGPIEMPVDDYEPGGEGYRLEAWINGEYAGDIRYSIQEESSPTWAWAPAEGSHLWIVWMHTQPKYRRTGVATALMNELKRRYPGYEIATGGFTDEGAGWWDARMSKTAAPAVLDPATDLGSIEHLDWESELEPEKGWQGRIDWGPAAVESVSKMLTDPIERERFMDRDRSPRGVSWETAREFLWMKANPQIKALLEAAPENEPFVANLQPWATWVIEQVPEGYRNSKTAGSAEQSLLELIGQLEMELAAGDYPRVAQLANQVTGMAQHYGEQVDIHDYDEGRRNRWFEQLGFFNTWKESQPIGRQLVQMMVNFESARRSAYQTIAQNAQWVEAEIAKSDLKGFEPGFKEKYVDAKLRQMMERGHYEEMYQILQADPRWQKAMADPERATGAMRGLVEWGMMDGMGKGRGHGDPTYQKIVHNERAAENIKLYVSRLRQPLEDVAKLEALANQAMDEAHGLRTKDVYIDEQSKLWQKPSEFMQFNPSPYQPTTIPEEWG